MQLELRVPESLMQALAKFEAAAERQEQAAIRQEAAATRIEEAVRQMAFYAEKRS